MDPGKVRARVIVGVLAIIAFILWLLSIYEARVRIGQGIGEFGLVSVLPIAFFVSLSMLSVSFLAALRMRNKSQIVLFCQIVMLIFYLNFTPAIIEGTTRFTSAYVNFRAVDYISQYGYINPLLVWIHNWPGFSIAFSILTQIAALPEQILLSIYPTLFNIGIFFPLFSSFCLVIDDYRLRWIAVWTFYFANWVNQDYFSMQSLGFLTFLLILFVMFRLVNQRTASRQWFIISVIFFSLTVISHVLTSLTTLAIILVFFASRQLRKPVFVFLFALILTLWTIYCASAYFQWKLPEFMDEVFNLELILQANVPARIAGSEAHIMVTHFRLIFSSLIALFAFSGLISTWNLAKWDDIGKRILLVLIGISVLLGLCAYGGEIYMRVYLFSLVPLSYFISKGSDRKTFFYLLTFFLITIAPPLYMISRYGNEVMDYVPPSEIKGFEFLRSKTKEGYMIGSGRWSEHYRDSKYCESYTYLSFSRTEWKDNKLSLAWIESKRPDWPWFVCIFYGTRKYYDFYLGDPKFIVDMNRNLSESIRYNRIYANPGAEVYLESTLVNHQNQ